MLQIFRKIGHSDYIDYCIFGVFYFYLSKITMSIKKIISLERTALKHEPLYLVDEWYLHLN